MLRLATCPAGATDPHYSPSTADALKDAVRESGLLDLLVARTRNALAAGCSSCDTAENEALSRSEAASCHTNCRVPCGFIEAERNVTCAICELWASSLPCDAVLTVRHG